VCANGLGRRGSRYGTIVVPLQSVYGGPMRTALALALVSVLVGACSSSPSDPGGGGSGTTTTGTTTETTTTTTDTTTTTTETSSCAAALDGECGACMKGACCDVLTACEGDADCLACVNGTDTTACEKTPETHDRATAFLACKGGPCQSTCIGSTGGTCMGVLDNVVGPTCGACLVASCCDEVAACNGDDGCWNKCFAMHDETACHADANGHAIYHALLTCVTADCSDACIGPTVTPACDAPLEAPSGGACVTVGGGTSCNPVTNEGCTAAGSACDVASGGYTCYPAPNDNAICAACGEADGWCMPGHTCVGGACARYCCDDGDCGTGHCDTAPLGGGSVGVCAM
jgi:hypothetical protein